MTQDQALDILKTGANVFLTGEPGAGKTHTINSLVNYLRTCDVEVSVTASTGIAATHVGGMTIHSWSGIGIKRNLDKYDLDKIASTEYIVKRVNRTKVLIIDEVSMLSSNILDMLDMVCREVKQNDEPFGGIQIILVGDFFQLPPISKREDKKENKQTSFLGEEGNKQIFAYDSGAWERAHFVICYLTEQHRQDDDNFLSVLSAIRADNFLEEHNDYINARAIEIDGMPENITKLFSHNFDVDRINNLELEKISSDKKCFMMTCGGNDNLVATLKKGCLSPENLELKIGAVVMCTKNNQKEHFVNGTLGTVIDFETFTGYPIIKTRGGYEITISPMDWSIEENGKIRAEITQIPLRLAWAMTVHKSQGMSLDAAVMDLSQVFEFGQGYVALSRVRRLSGLYLLGINELALKVHPEILKKDIVFKNLSNEAEKVFGKLSKSEMEKMHKDFVVASGGKFVKSSTLSLSTKPPLKRGMKTKGAPSTARPNKNLDTQSITLALWNEGKDISEIAKERGLVEKTIFYHIEDLVKENKITLNSLLRIVSPELKKSFPEIHKTFRSMEDDKLAPVMEKLNKKYSYDELRIARMFLDK